MVCSGLMRPSAGYLLFAPCGPCWSKLSAREITLPLRTRRAAATMSSGRVWFSVPISSSGPQRPQFLYFSAASRRSWRVSLRSGMGHPQKMKRIAYQAGAIAVAVLATALGIAVGLFRLSRNFLLRTLAAAYVEFIRNSPLLVQLFFWYALISEALPSPREALQPLPGFFLTNRGLFFPLPGSIPLLEGFNFAGGMVLTPEFAALLVGLSVYTAAFIAEIVRAGVLSVSRGQWDAAHAVGLERGQALRHVIM